jgi:hypothetical protein
MRRPTIVLAGLLAAAVAAVAAWAADEIPFPSAKVAGVFVAAHTVTAPSSSLGEGVLTNYYPQGSTVVFRVFAGATEGGKILTADDVKYAYVKLPSGATVKLTWSDPAKTTQPAWTGTWDVPANYPPGLVKFTVRFKTKDKQYGNFVQIPVASSQLTITKA